MRSYLLLFTMALVLTLLLTPLVRARALAWGAVDLPDDQRRIHGQPTPRLGGVAIYWSVLLSLLAVPAFNNLVSQSFYDHRRQMMGMFVAATLIFLLGVYDDFHGLNAPVKISVQVIAAAILYWNGFQINALSLPVIGSWAFPDLAGFPLFGFLLTAVWVVGITNAFNLIDGIDGLASGAAMFAFLSLFITSLFQGHPEVALLSIILIGAVMGFLRYNFNPATIFLGDSGSLLLGFLAAALSLASAQKSPTLVAIAIPLVSFGLPIAETGLSMSRRFLSGQPIFQGDRRHIHHMLLNRGLSQRQAVILLYAICALFSLFGILLLNPQRNVAALIFLVIGAGFVLGVQHLRYHEFGALGMQIKQGASRRRRLRAELRTARNAAELLETLWELLQASGFDGGQIEISAPEISANLSGELREPASAGNGTARLAEREPFIARWVREKLSRESLLSSDGFWSLRAPLADGKGRALGSITFYRDVMLGDPPADFTQMCGLVRQELNGALDCLYCQDRSTVQESAAQESTAPARLKNFPVTALESDQ